MTETLAHLEQTKAMLQELGFLSHLGGFRQLCVAIPYYAQNPSCSMTKELYPYINHQPGCSGDVESSIRRIIAQAWKRGSRDVWEKYFPGFTEPPSNLVFIAALAIRLK